MRAYLALGGNLGDRAANIREAVRLLDAMPGIRVLEMSCLYETEPVGMAEAAANWFANAAVSIDTGLTPEELLDACLSVERQLGRERAVQGPANGYSSRTMDIDILFYGDQVIREEGLQIPHPRLHERAFMLVPMLELAPNLRHPVLNRTIQEMHLALAAPEQVKLSGMIETGAASR